jgi:23S rRNA pseudouridine1911/1915/1917 synthase
MTSTLALPLTGPILSVIYEDDRLLVVNKPANLVCHPTKTDAFSSLIGRVRLYLSQSHGVDSATESFIPSLAHRLDRETSGLVLAAKNSETARFLGKAMQRREIHKEYQAIVWGQVHQDHGMIDAPLGKDQQSLVAIKDTVCADGAPARTLFYVEKRFIRPEGPFTLLRVMPQTGRKHQIRLHLAHIGHPIVGDKIYGGDETVYLNMMEDKITEEQRRRLLTPCQALHACQLRFGWAGADRTFTADPEPWFTEFHR